MEVQPDFKELLKLLNAHKAEFIIVGAYALAFHGVPRFTGDMDILVKPDPKNAEKIMAALELTQPTASHHLNILESAELVEKNRQGKWIFYSIANQDLLRLIERMESAKG